MTETRPTETYWHVDRRIPVALIAAVAAQTLGWVWWAASSSKQIEQHDTRIAVVERYIESTRGPSLLAAERFTRVEVRMENIESSLAEIKNLIRGRVNGDGRN